MGETTILAQAMISRDAATKARRFSPPAVRCRGRRQAERVEMRRLARGLVPCTGALLPSRCMDKPPHPASGNFDARADPWEHSSSAGTRP